MKIAGTLAALLLLSTLGCFSGAHWVSGHHHESDPCEAVVMMSSPSKDVVGFLALTQMKYGVKLVGWLMGLKPGRHGMHVHSFGDVKTDGCTSTGSHYNPHNATHGGPYSAPYMRHVGDLGNVVANEQGIAVVNIFDRVISLIGPLSIDGRAIVVHAQEDNLTPNANPGSRVGCGTIVKITKTKKYH
jgi:Cu-Zn family superoxide dismutase